MANDTLPQVDAAYWFEYSKNIVDSAIERRNTAAATLQKLVLWLWGIYTSFTAVGFALSDKTLDLTTTILIAAASSSLIVVYWCTVWVQMPCTHSFDPRSPTQIRKSHIACTTSKGWKLTFTLFLSVVSAVLVAVSLVMASIGKPVKLEDDRFAASLVQHDQDYYIVASAWIDKSKQALITVYPDEKKAENDRQMITALPDKDGFVYEQFRLKQKPKSTTVIVSWKNAQGVNISLSRTLTKPETF